jgi:hypothetical protein
MEWAGEPGLRHWVELGCGPETPGVSVYDPEGRDLTPTSELRRFPASISRAADFVASTGCHRFGLAPGSTPLFGIDPASCSYDLDRGSYEGINWKSVDIIDIQSQRLLGQLCHKRWSEYLLLCRFVRGAIRADA